MVHATNDKAVPVENSIDYYMSLKNKNIPVELHVFEKGGHGFGMGLKEKGNVWTKQCEIWLMLNYN